MHPEWPWICPGGCRALHTCRRRQAAPAQGFLSFHSLHDWCELMLRVESGSKGWEVDEAFAAEDEARSAITLQVRFIPFGEGFGLGFEPRGSSLAKIYPRRCYLEMVVQEDIRLV